ncbi:MAG TPA: ubiquinone biosynthesis protein UbiB [Gammaproteobacteria bacterium]|nr:ubiquinone biosynthesis protein UbiB [Gammaproteobacteria bacterium]
MFWETLGAARDLGRLHNIASVLIRHGMGELVRRLGIGHFLEQAGKILHWKESGDIDESTAPQRMRAVLQELGPTFIKLGQVMATRVDLFPPEWIEEFEKLQDNVPAVSYDELAVQLEEDLGRPAEEVFPHLEREALAAASIAQVHRAELPDGTRVVLKIRRPGIEKTVNADLHLLARFAEIAEAEIPELRRYHPVAMVRQFSRSLRRELNLENESRAAERVAANLADQPDIIIPKIYWQWTSKRLNVQQYIDGIPARDFEAIEAAGLDRSLLARRGVNAMLRMTLIDGFFHADPHQGNLFYLPENRIAFIDFGMTGSLSQLRREQVADLLYGLMMRETDNIIDVLQDWTGGVSSIDTDRLNDELEAFLDSYHGLALKQLDFAAMLGDLMALFRDHQLSLPPDLSMLLKAFISLDGLGRKLDPDFNIVAEITPFLQRLIMKRYLPSSLLKQGWSNLSGGLDILTSLPRDIRRLLRMARRGALQVHVDVTRLDHFGHQLDRAASRLSVGMVTAALIIGTSIVMTAPDAGPTVWGYSLFVLLGFVAACMGCVWLWISIWRGKRE